MAWFIQSSCFHLKRYPFNHDGLDVQNVETVIDLKLVGKAFRRSPQGFKGQVWAVASPAPVKATAA